MLKPGMVVCAVKYEPVSVRQNSHVGEKYREKRQHLHKLATKIAKAQRPWGFLVKNAPNNNREKIFNNREALQNNREKYSFRQFGPSRVTMPNRPSVC